MNNRPAPLINAVRVDNPLVYFRRTAMLRLIAKINVVEIETSISIRLSSRKIARTD